MSDNYPEVKYKLRWKYTPRGTPHGSEPLPSDRPEMWHCYCGTIALAYIYAKNHDPNNWHEEYLYLGQPQGILDEIVNGSNKDNVPALKNRVEKEIHSAFSRLQTEEQHNWATALHGEYYDAEWEQAVKHFWEE